MNTSQIKTNLQYRLIGSGFMKRMVIKTVQFFPDNIADFVSKKCWFISSFEDGYAFVVKGDEIKRGEYLIFLSDELLEENERQIHYSIVHEIGHVVLGHKNSIGEVQSKKEVSKQEKEADEFVKKYLFE